MTQSLDSRALCQIDCYGQRFKKAGTYQYHVLPAGGQWLTDSRPFAVKVSDNSAGKGPTQHTIQIKASRGKFAIDRELEIAAGDVVLWNCGDRGAPPYVIAGEKSAFGNQRLSGDCVYSHAFGTPGKYHWFDVYGSGIEGVVEVTGPRLEQPVDIEKWQRAIANPVLITIAKKSVAPSHVEIMVGQTVFFAVQDGGGISVTDREAPTAGQLNVFERASGGR